jgi:tetratricopeptide (TPR) repeat protein
MKRVRLGIVVVFLLVLGGAMYAIAVQLFSHPAYRAAQQALARRDFETASRHLREYLQDRPNDLDAQLLAAQTARRQGDLAQAADLLQAYARQAGPNSDLEFEQQLLRIQRGDLALAESLRARLVDRPNVPQTTLLLEAVIEGSWYRLFMTLQREMAGQGEVTVADITRVQRLVDQWLTLCTTRADQAQGHIWRGKLETLAREFPKAEAEFRQAVELDPDHFTARQHLATSLALQAPEEAAQHLELLHQRDPANARVTFQLATVRRDLGQPDQAARLLDALLDVNPNSVAYLVERGRVALDQRMPKDAETWLRQAVALAPKHAQANLFLSQSLEQSQREDEAKVFRDRFLQIESEGRRQADKFKEKGTESK